jgi:hypothetical protein
MFSSEPGGQINRPPSPHEQHTFPGFDGCEKSLEKEDVPGDVSERFWRKTQNGNFSQNEKVRYCSYYKDAWSSPFSLRHRKHTGP